MESAIVCLAIAVGILSLLSGVTLATIPLLWYRHLKLEQDLKTLDEIIAKLLDAAGVNKS